MNHLSTMIIIIIINFMYIVHIKQVPKGNQWNERMRMKDRRNNGIHHLAIAKESEEQQQEE